MSKKLFPMRDRKDRKVIEAFVDYLRANGYPDLRIECWPEDKGSKEIDAIAGAFAIEHTSIDTLPLQRRNSHWYMQVVGGLGKELNASIPFHLSITVDYQAIRKRQRCPDIRNSLKTWIITHASQLKDGCHDFNDVAGVPFSLHIEKVTGLCPGIYFALSAPSDHTLVNRVKEQLDRKAKKLLKYQHKNMITVLLVESDDIALMTESKMWATVQKAYPDGPPSGADQLWYADTSIPEEILFRNFTAHIKQKRRRVNLSD